jgi:hypothetical protein
MFQNQTMRMPFSKNKFKYCAGIIFLLISNLSGYGQTCCSGGAPLTGALNIQSMNAGSFGLSFSYNNNNLKDLVQGTDVINEDYISRNTKSVFTQLDFGINNNLTATVLIPYIVLQENIRSLSGESRVSANGISDVLIMLQLAKSLRNEASIVFAGGLKIPTGPTGIIDNDTDIILPANLQPGTGSFDFVATSQYRTSLYFRKSLSLTQTLNFRANSSSSNFTFHDSYRFGHVFQSFTTLSEQLVIGKMLNVPSLTLHYRFAGPDIVDGFARDNTGGQWLYAGPGWRVNLNSQIILGVSGEIPIYRKLNGFQITTSHQWVMTLQFLISNSKESL